MSNYDLTYEGSEVQSILDTGEKLREDGYILMGGATPSTLPGTPTKRVAYIGGPGSYSNFGTTTVVPSGSIGVFKYTGSAWSNEVIACTVPISTSVEDNDTTVPTGKAVKTAVDAVSGAVSDEATARENADGALQTAINNLGAKLAEGYIYVGIATPTTNPGTPAGKVLYIATAAGTYTNFLNGSSQALVLTQGINILKYNGTSWAVEQLWGVDDTPTPSSNKLVKSGGVFNDIMTNGSAFDLTAYNNGTTYADLNAALTALNALPAAYKKGGMSLKFVLTSDNKYVQFRYMGTATTGSPNPFLNTDNWAFCDDSILVENPEYICAETDKDGKLLEAIENDGRKVEFGDFEVKGHIFNKELEESIGSMVEKEEGKSLIDENVAAGESYVENPEYINAEIDAEGNLLESRENDGTKVFDTDVKINKTLRVNNIKTSGKEDFEVPQISIDGVVEGTIDDPEDRMDIGLDGEKKIVHYRDENGVQHENVGLETIHAKIDDIELGNEAKDYIAEEISKRSNIIDFYPDNNFIPILANYKHYLDGSWGNPGWQDPDNFTLLWMSDIHSVGRRLGRIMEFYNHYKDYIDDIISTGDQDHAYNMSYDFWRENGGAPVLSVLGNHDVHGPARDMGNYIIKAWSVPAYGQKECYDKFFKPFLNDTHIVIEDNKCYFYKDYPEFKIRIIGTDDFHFNEHIQVEQKGDIPIPEYATTIYPDGTSVDTGQQLTWFENVLNETLDENNAAYGYSVICLNHHPTYINYINCPFTSLYHVNPPLMKVAFPAKVHEFIENGGKFVAWVVGDSHVDGFGTLRDYPEQLQMIIDTSGSREPNSGAYARIEGTVSDDLFNILSVNTYKGLVILKRIGADYDKFGRHTDCMVYDYINKNIIQTN